METEEDFHTHLDAHPDDHTGRMVFADWLQEREDPRAEGYRAMGMLRRRPLNCLRQWFWCSSLAEHGAENYLPFGWLASIDNAGPENLNWSDYRPQKPGEPWTRREAEDAAALAWGKLSEAARNCCREVLGELAGAL